MVFSIFGPARGGRRRGLAAWAVLLTVALTGCAGGLPLIGGSDAPPADTTAMAAAAADASGDGPKPFGEVVPDTAETDTGLFTTHRTADEFYLSIPDSLLGREVLMVSRVAQAPSGLAQGGEKTNTQVLRWTRRGDELLLRVVSHEKTADPDAPIYRAVRNASFEPILETFDVEARTPDSSGVVVEATDLFTGAAPGLGLPESLERRFSLGGVDDDRSYLEGVESFPKNTDVEVLLTYRSSRPPSTPSAQTVSVVMNHSMVLLPETPMRPRHCDRRVGYFSVRRTNYSTDEQEAAEECLITRWRLAPRDMAAFRRGELVEPKEPIVYYVDPATPEKWRPYIRAGVEAWNEAFRAAGFKNAVVAKSPSADSTFDADDIRFSTIRYFASETQNAYGPHVHDPRSGEILEADIALYHNVLKLLRAWYVVQTAPANARAQARTLETDVMGRLLQFIVTHEVGHTLGLPHNWAASDAVPVDSLRSPAYTENHGTATSIMDYARFNYVAQPADGVTNFLPKIGVYDEWSVRWGYRPLPDASSPEAASDTLDAWIEARADDPRYFYGRQTLLPVDPRSQAEDLGRNALEASRLGVENLKRLVPNLVAWTRADGAGYDLLETMHEATIRQWTRYMGHVAIHIGGVHETFKTYDQEGPVYEPVPGDTQRRAMEFITEHALDPPTWLVEPDVLRRFRASESLYQVREAQHRVLTLLMTPLRLARLVEQEVVAGPQADPYTLPAMLEDVRTGVWRELETGAPIGPYRRNLQRAYLDQLRYLLTADLDLLFPDWAERYLVTTSVDIAQSDVRAYLRRELRTLQDQTAAALDRTRDPATAAHLRDVRDRIEGLLDPDAEGGGPSTTQPAALRALTPAMPWPCAPDAAARWQQLKETAETAAEGARPSGASYDQKR